MDTFIVFSLMVKREDVRQHSCFDKFALMLLLMVCLNISII